jgi:DNA-binding XRE family transcriptional regulator
MGWAQDVLAARLGISRRTLSHWETGHWLPPIKLRPHIVLALRNAPPEYVLEMADSLGVSVTPGTESMLQPFRDALEADQAEPAPPVPPPRVPPNPVVLRGAVDDVLRDAADEMNVSANELRAVLVRTLAACADQQATLEEAQAAVAVRERRRKR